jgi:hypothetical protein
MSTAKRNEIISQHRAAVAAYNAAYFAARDAKANLKKAELAMQVAEVAAAHHGVYESTGPDYDLEG